MSLSTMNVKDWGMKKEKLSLSLSIQSFVISVGYFIVMIQVNNFSYLKPKKMEIILILILAFLLWVAWEDNNGGDLTSG